MEQKIVPAPKLCCGEGCQMLGETKSIVGEEVYFFSLRENVVLRAKVVNIKLTLRPKGEMSILLNLHGDIGGKSGEWLVPAIDVHQNEEAAKKHAQRHNGVVVTYPTPNTWALDRILGEIGSWLVAMKASSETETTLPRRSG